MKKPALKKIKNLLLAYPDWKTQRKIIVFESDDWGSIRMPSKDIYDFCLRKGYAVDKNTYTRYDSLASEEDLNLLFSLLRDFKDYKGNNPKITANCLVANPDFNKIRDSDFNNYFFEPITDTFRNYPAHSNNFKLWNIAKNEGIFFPQSHGREHLNVSRFMRDLRKQNQDLWFAFDLEMPGIFPQNNVRIGNEYVVALEHNDEEDKNDKIKISIDGLELFEKLFHYHSTSFIANNYVWPNELENRLYEKGVNIIQGSRFQLVPKGNYKGFRKKFHFTGQKNKNKQIYLVRNAQFEPSSDQNKDWVDYCLKDIESAFKRSNAAIISVHRVNFVGLINIKNRDRNLILFRKLLIEILKKWPTVEFLNTVELGSLIAANNNN